MDRPPLQVDTRKGPLHLLLHWYFLAHATAWLAGAFIRADWYFKTRAMDNLQVPAEHPLTSKEIRRFQHYFYGTTYLSIVFCVLRGRTRTRAEKNGFTNLAALAYYFDDLVQMYHHQDQSGVQWSDNPEQYGLATDPSGRALHFLHNIYAALPLRDLETFKQYMQKVFVVETGGRQRLRENIALEELDHIAAEKGAYSVLMFRRTLANPISDPEEKALYAFGHLIQTCDDIFDVWFDLKEGVKTVPLQYLTKNTVEELQIYFEERVSECRMAMLKTGSGGHAARTAWAVIAYLVSITRVCVRHYQILQKKHGTLPLHDRHEMVVDMERNINRLRAFRCLMLDCM